MTTEPTRVRHLPSCPLTLQTSNVLQFGRSHACSAPFPGEYEAAFCSGGEHVPIDVVEAEFVAAQTANLDAVRADRLAGLPGSSRVTEMDGDFTPVLVNDHVREQTDDPAVHQQLF